MKFIDQKKNLRVLHYTRDCRDGTGYDIFVTPEDEAANWGLTPTTPSATTENAYDRFRYAKLHLSPHYGDEPDRPRELLPPLRNVEVLDTMAMYPYRWHVAVSISRQTLRAIVLLEGLIDGDSIEALKSCPKLEKIAVVESESTEMSIEGLVALRNISSVREVRAYSEKLKNLKSIAEKVAKRISGCEPRMEEEVRRSGRVKRNVAF